MIIINGGKFNDNATLIKNVINVNANFCKKIDETKNELAKGVDRIAIDSDVPVKVSACDTNDITVHLHGSAIMDSNLELSLIRHGDEIRVSVDVSNSYNNMSIISQNTIHF